MKTKRHIIAKNIATLLHDGDFVNLGIGIPTLIGNYLPEGVTILLHGENGYVGQEKELSDLSMYETRERLYDWWECHGGERTDYSHPEGHRDLVNAGGFFINLIPGACCFDSAMAFSMVRGGHLDVTVLGGLQVDRHGNLANWMVPGKKISGVGGAMDLAAGTPRVIVAMEHCTKSGEMRILDECTMPLTAKGCVNTLVTELCIIDFEERGPVVKAMAPGLTRKELQERTGTKLVFAEEIKQMEVL